MLKLQFIKALKNDKIEHIEGKNMIALIAVPVLGIILLFWRIRCFIVIKRGKERMALIRSASDMIRQMENESEVASMDYS